MDTDCDWLQGQASLTPLLFPRWAPVWWGGLGWWCDEPPPFCSSLTAAPPTGFSTAGWVNAVGQEWGRKARWKGQLTARNHPYVHVFDCMCITEQIKGRILWWWWCMFDCSSTCLNIGDCAESCTMKRIWFSSTETKGTTHIKSPGEMLGLQKSFKASWYRVSEIILEGWTILF